MSMGIKYRIAGRDVPHVTSAKIPNTCEAISKFMSRNDAEALGVWHEVCQLFEPVTELTRDRLKGSRFVAEIRSRVLQV